MFAAATASPVNVPESRPAPTGPRIVRRSGTALIGAWAAFWSWFAASVAISEGGQSWLYGGGIVLGCLTVALATVLWPRVGGALAIAAGLFIAWFFHGAQAILLFATPPIIGGTLAVVGGWMVARKR